MSNRKAGLQLAGQECLSMRRNVENTETRLSGVTVSIQRLMLTNIPRVVFEEAEEVSISNAVCLLLMVSK